MIISNSMLIADEKYQIGRVSRQMPAVLGWMKEIGRQERPRRTACTQAQMPTYTIHQKVTLCTHFRQNMRRNCNKKDILRTFIPIL